MNALAWTAAVALTLGFGGGAYAIEAQLETVATEGDTCVGTVTLANGRICAVQHDGGTPDESTCVHQVQAENRTWCDATLSGEHTGGACVKGTWNKTHQSCTLHAKEGDVCLGHHHDNRTGEAHCNQRVVGAGD